MHKMVCTLRLGTSAVSPAMHTGHSVCGFIENAPGAVVLKSLLKAYEQIRDKLTIICFF